MPIVNQPEIEPIEETQEIPLPILLVGASVIRGSLKERDTSDKGGKGVFRERHDETSLGDECVNDFIRPGQAHALKGTELSDTFGDEGNICVSECTILPSSRQGVRGVQLLHHVKREVISCRSPFHGL
jgi:hypothetical protein